MDVTVGQVAYCEVMLTAETVDEYVKLTSDYNPLRLGEGFVSKGAT
jgi:hypothetical protein